jgi:hypothetical protein
MSSKFLSIAGALLLVHAAYSCMTYRELVQELVESGAFESADPPPQVPPVDVLVEVAIGFFSILVAELTREASMLRPIQSYQNKMPLMAPIYKTREFDIYSTRARGLCTMVR